MRRISVPESGSRGGRHGLGPRPLTPSRQHLSPAPDAGIVGMPDAQWHDGGLWGPPRDLPHLNFPCASQPMHDGGVILRAH
jgi:hypothetical protein